MATLLLTAAGTALGGAAAFSGLTFLGMSAATVFGTIGGMLGARIDAGLFNPQKSQTIEGFRMDDLAILSSTEGMAMPRLYGTARLPGNIIWATELEEVEDRATVRGPRRYGLFGPRASQTTIEYFYYTSFAVALCQGPINGVLRIWADGELLDYSLAEDIRVYNGSEDQEPDSLIQEIQGGDVPAYKGTAYIVFERLELTDFGNRIPNLTFEVVRPSEREGTLEIDLQGVALLPGSGEATLDTIEPPSEDGRPNPVLTGLLGPWAGSVTINNDDDEEEENLYVSPSMQSLRQLETVAPNCKNLLLVISWFGDDLRAGNCKVQPRAEFPELGDEDQLDDWIVSNVLREQAVLVSQENGSPVFGGTYGDDSVVRFIRAAKSRGYNIVIYPFIMMDIPADNTLPNPYSNNEEDEGQPVYPWRGRITCSPAAGYAGTVDKTSDSVTQVDDFFGNAAIEDFTAFMPTGLDGPLALQNPRILFEGDPDDWGFRRMILHYAHLCKEAGGVSAFLVGTELIGLTTIRDDADSYPVVDKLKQLAADVKTILGGSTKVSYAADWTEYFGHHPQDGSGDVFFHLDPFWSDSNVDFIGIDNYMPLSDWRDERDQADAEFGSIYNLEYLSGNVEGGEGYDWYYETYEDRQNQVRTPITDGDYGKPWVFRYKDLRNWWLNPHYNRPGGVESGTPTSWVPQSKPFWFTEYGCPAIDKGTNQPNVFLDDKSSESFAPYFSNKYRDDAIQRAYFTATHTYWNDEANNPLSSDYGAPMIDMNNAYAWAWDVRPYPVFPAESGVWEDAGNYELGHWLNGRLGGYTVKDAVAEECLFAGYELSDISTDHLYGYFTGYVITQAMAVRDSITNLGNAMLFSGYEVNGTLTFRSEYTRDAYQDIEYDDLIVIGDDDSFVRNRKDDIELPRSLRWRLLWDMDDYEGMVIQADMNSEPLRSLQTDSYELTVADVGGAYASCAATLYNLWAARESLTLSLPMYAIDYFPSDYVEFTYEGVSKGYVISQKTISDKIELTLTAVSVKLSDVRQRISRKSSRSFIGETERISSLTLLNIPALSEETMQPLFYLAPAGVLSRINYIVYDYLASRDSDGLVSVTDPVPALTSAVPLVTLLNDIPACQGSYIVTEGYIEVSTTALLSTVSVGAFLRGESLIAVRHNLAPTTIGGELLVTYEHELILFQSAELVDLSGTVRTYRLRNYVRGYRGGERLANNPVIAAETPTAVLVTPSVFMDSAAADVGGLDDILGYIAYPSDASPDSPRRAIAYNRLLGTPVKPFSPVHLHETETPYVYEWVRRSRAFDANEWGASDPSLVETEERYRVLVVNSSGDTLRDLVVSTAYFEYTSSQRNSDFGTDTPTDFSIEVCQIGDSMESDYVKLNIGA